ncbi:uncharacterized protein Z519_11047 [Cladophialophora bantiana CBS 173.52]|uniref:Bacteriophage T5 Orf172 DNA-binding domain-containing protein n=1 Tax=Cladophialophora bantiana (strain ATCC 10958 / CBS 173.52 / CDC B-1940 / NIH 8579) TaxID=1442370 RepID=A0A0D2H5A9_CLAB1|nr:uncharacterized protein Z519_11047 [Cladophialophora bantiana CBS 173.52]KIW88478.1 hypothetical protein Z519_11047 [Cladophialophora bantiana CBS 173.52]
MSQKYPATNDKWLTIVTLRVFFQRSTFSPSFRYKLTESTRSKILCSCQQLSDLHPGHNAKNLIRGLLPSDHFTVRFIISGAEKVEQAKRLCTPQANRQFDDAKEFRFWIRSLAILLSELCESDHARDYRSEQRDLGLRPFRTGSLTTRSVCEDIRRILNTPLRPSEQQGHGMGYVYVLRSQMGPSTMALLKIGFSKFHPEHRAHELARCLARPEVVSHTPLVPHAKRLELIIHTELQSCRKIQSCLRCCKDHREWFVVSHAESREVLTRWSTWVLQRPYVDGKLTDKWKDHLGAKDFKSLDDSTSLAAFWRTIIDEFPQGGSKDDRSRRIGKYLNDCYWDVMCDQLGTTQYGKDFCDSLREDVPLGPSGTGTWRDELQASLDTAGEQLRDLQMKNDGRDDGYEMDDHDALENLPIEVVFRPGRSYNDLVDDPDTRISAIFSTNTYLGRMYHPETKVRHLLNPDKSPGPLLRSFQRQVTESKAATKDILKLHESMKTLKTGAFSVSDPILGVTESPLGDATMLPVLAIKDLKYLNPLVANWVGMNPTNAGFQYIQEAYANGKWFGRKPRFQLPKAYRRAGYKSLSAKDADNASSSKRRAQERAKDGKITPEPLADGVDPDRIYNQPSFQLTRGPESDEFRWTVPINDEFIEKVNQGLEEIRNGGRADIEQKLAKALRDVGVDVSTSDDEDMTDSDSFISSDSSSSEEEGGDLQAEPSSRTLPMVPAKRRKESSGSIDLISAKKAKSWLQLL